MATYSTAQLAKLMGIGRDTLQRWMRRADFPRPRVTRVGGVSVRLWTQADVARVRKYKAENYGKGKGFKKK